jgi:hypothetical protein
VGGCGEVEKEEMVGTTTGASARTKRIREEVARLARHFPWLRGEGRLHDYVAVLDADDRLTVDDISGGVERVMSEFIDDTPLRPGHLKSFAHLARRDRLEREKEAGVEYPLSRVAIHGRRCSRPGCHGALELLPERMLWCERCQSIPVVEKVDGKLRVILSEVEAAALTYGTPGEPAHGNTLVTREQMDELMARIAAATFRVGRS